MRKTVPAIFTYSRPKMWIAFIRIAVVPSVFRLLRSNADILLAVGKVCVDINLIVPITVFLAIANGLTSRSIGNAK